MGELKRAMPALLAFLLLGLAVSLAWTMFQATPEALIDSMLLRWKLRAGLLLFVKYLPALFTSGIVTGYAIAFAPRDGRAGSNTPRWSADHLEQLRGAFLLCIAVLAIYVALSEGARPILVRHQASDLAKSEEYHEYIRLAGEDISRGSFREALPRVELALQIRKDDAEALRLREETRKGLAETEGEELSAVGSQEAPDEEIFNPENLTVRTAMERSKAASRASDWYTAHYYALLAWRLAPGTDPLKQDALRMASEAWNRITEGSGDTANEAEAGLFATKQAGYESIQHGDFLNAYYILEGLRDGESGNVDGKEDPDVPRLLEIATKGLLDTHFFLDETSSLKAFEGDRNVFFTIARADGGRDAFFARGITYSRFDGRDLAYLRGLEFASFAADGSVLYHYVDPYAKMFPWRDRDGIERPEILLRAVDRSVRGAGTSPSIVQGEASERDLGVLVLDMPFRDFSLATLANRGMDSMDLADLMRFVDKAGRYGYSSQAFMREIVVRLADPFIVLIVAMLMLAMGWKYRLAAKVFFKAWWVLPLPALPFILEGILEFARYFMALFVAVFVVVAPAGAMFLTLAALALVFIATAIFFFSQRSE